jgi:hypothetical protein
VGNVPVAACVEYDFSYGKEVSDYKTRLNIIAGELKANPKFKDVPEAMILASADKMIRGHEITKASAGAAQSVPVKEREAAIHGEKVNADIVEKAGKIVNRELTMPGPIKKEFKALKTPEDQEAYKNKLLSNAIERLKSGTVSTTQPSGKGQDYSKLWN